MNSPSDFHITETPTLHFVATENEQRLAEHLQERLKEALRLAEETDEVAAAVDTHRAVEDRLKRLKSAESTLHQFARTTGIEAAGSAQKSLDRIIETAGTGRPDFGGIAELAELEERNRHTGRALERLVEHLIPLAQIAELRADSHELLTRVRAIEAVAQQRAEKLLGQLRGAVIEEIVLPVDMSKGVAGALLAHAAGLKKLAVQQSENADRIERSYTIRRSEEKQ